MWRMSFVMSWSRCIQFIGTVGFSALGYFNKWLIGASSTESCLLGIDVTERMKRKQIINTQKKADSVFQSSELRRCQVEIDNRRLRYRISVQRNVSGVGNRCSAGFLFSSSRFQYSMPAVDCNFDNLYCLPTTIDGSRLDSFYSEKNDPNNPMTVRKGQGTLWKALKLIFIRKINKSQIFRADSAGSALCASARLVNQR